MPLVKQLSHLPVIVDPSQGTGKRSLVAAVSLAAVAAGADGLIVEIHPHPDSALKDGAQSLTLEQYRGSDATGTCGGAGRRTRVRGSRGLTLRGLCGVAK